MIPQFLGQRKAYVFSVILVFCSFFVSQISCSTGDRLPEFQTCVQRCVTTRCENNLQDTHSDYQHEYQNSINKYFKLQVDSQPGPADAADFAQLPLPLRLTFWTCPQNCDYLCQRAVTKARIEHGYSIEQFHGKWPFKRLFGVQEPLSVLFSVMNFIPHYHGFKMLTGFLGSSSAHSVPQVLVYTYMGIAITGMNAWTWSSVFHVRDFIMTERLDYFSAGLTVLYGFYACVIRVFGLYKTTSSSPVDASTSTRNQLLRRLLAIVCTIAYFAHVYYLQFVRFDYGYNMLANVVVGLFQNGMWIYLAISEYRKPSAPLPASSNFVPKTQRSDERQGWKLMPLYLVISVTLAMSFELLDFPPLFDALDAHALWHAGTVLPTYFWYIWINHDLKSFKTHKAKM